MKIEPFSTLRVRKSCREGMINIFVRARRLGLYLVILVLVPAIFQENVLRYLNKYLPKLTGSLILITSKTKLEMI